MTENLPKQHHRDNDRREIREAIPPPAHTKSITDKNFTANVANIHPPYAAAAAAAAAYASPKDKQPPLPSHRDIQQYTLHHEKPSVIVQPDKSHSISPKQRIPGRASPYQQSGLYKNYEISQSPHRSGSGTPHNPSPHSVAGLAPSPHTVELIKTRQPQSSPRSTTSSPAHHDQRYLPVKSPATSYQSSPHPAHITQPNLSSHPQLTVHQHHSTNSSHSLQQSSHHQAQTYNNPSVANSSRVSVSVLPNPHHSQQVSMKKVNSPPPPQMYTHPADAPRVNPQHGAHAKPQYLSAPPPAHSRNHDKLPPPPHEPRAIIDRGRPYEATSYPNVPSPHLKPLPTPVVTQPPLSRPTVAVTVQPAVAPVTMTPAVTQQGGNLTTQIQPLDLGRRDTGGAASPSKRLNQTPALQDAKKPRLDVSSTNQPLLTKVSEPSPLYPAVLATITSEENTAALSNINRSNSPTPSNTSLSRPPSQPPASVTPTPSRPDSTNSPGSNSTTKSEPEKSNSPGLSGGCYVHKLKKAWLQRHKNGAEVSSSPKSSSPSQSIRSTTPPPTAINGNNASNGRKSPTALTKTEESSSKPWKNKGVSNLPNGHNQDTKDLDSSTTDSEEDSNSTPKPKRGKGKRPIKRPKKSSESESDKESDSSETISKKSSRLASKMDLEPKKRGRKPKKAEKEKEDGPKPKKIKEELIGDPLKKPPLHQLKKTGESFLQDGSCFEVSSKLPKCRECRWTAHQRNKKMPNIFCRFYAFRRLRYTKNGQLSVAGFSDPIKVIIYVILVNHENICNRNVANWKGYVE